MATLFCQNCGTARIADTQQCCASCGTRFGSQTTTDSTQPVNRPNMGNPTNTNQPPKNWLLESILATLFCCLPLGVVGIVNAMKVESRFYAGDIETAVKAAEDAKKWTIISAITGVVLGFIYGIITLIAALSEG